MTPAAVALDAEALALYGTRLPEIGRGARLDTWISARATGRTGDEYRRP